MEGTADAVPYCFEGGNCVMETGKGADAIGQAADGGIDDAESAEVDRQTADRRSTQLKVARGAVLRMRKELGAAREAERRLGDLTSHLAGFYAEIDKLAKGKSIFEASDLVVAQTNDIVRDAKSMVEGDTYLDRVKEFIPAGDNPKYPDVIVTLTTVRQAIQRCGARMQADRARKADFLLEVRTVAAAIECYLEGNEDASEEDVQEKLGGETLAAQWFFEDEYGDSYFDFEGWTAKT